MTHPTRDPWGRLVCDPAALDHGGKVDVLRQLAGRLLASAAVDEQWLARGIASWLNGDSAGIEQALALRPARGSRRTAPMIVRRKMQRAALRRAVVELGTLRAVAEAMQGPAGAAAVADLRALGAPTSRPALARLLAVS